VGVISFTAEAYARVQKALLPPGRLWSLNTGSVISAVFLAAGDELARVSGRAVDMIEEADGSTTTELLLEFESDLDLVSTGTDAARRLRITAKETARPSFRPDDVIAALAPFLDLAIVDIVLIEISNAQAIAVGDERLVYQFYVYRNPALAGTPDIDAAQVELDLISHSHTNGFVVESISMLCDDPESLCDRDLLGV
jgi:hypothetical protein